MKRDLIIVGALWLALTAIGELLAVFVDIYPLARSDKGEDIEHAFRVLIYFAVPVFTMVVAVLVYTVAQAVGGWDSGWTAYPPLSVQIAHGQLFFNLAIITFWLSSILGGLNFLITIINLRAPGMTWGRLPIFVWPWSPPASSWPAWTGRMI